jgi:hypothetical protein
VRPEVRNGVLRQRGGVIGKDREAWVWPLRTLVGRMTAVSDVL